MLNFCPKFLELRVCVLYSHVYRITTFVMRLRIFNHLNQQLLRVLEVLQKLFNAT